ncbi:MAG: Crp/Fnr family transcriptional regulator [Alphaproteobacteria bacterium]
MVRNGRYTQDVFESLGRSEEQLVESLTGRSRSLPPNRLLVDKGEVGVVLYRIIAGWAYRYRIGGEGCRQILDFLMPGEIIGLQAATLGVLDHSVRSLTALHVSMIDARIVGEAFRSEPNLAMRLSRHAAAEAARVDELLTVIGCSDAVGRIAYLMLSLYHRQAARAEIDPLACPFPLRRQHLADVLGLTGAHINRTLNRLREEGIATLDSQILSIRDLPRLTELTGNASR